MTVRPSDDRAMDATSRRVRLADRPETGVAMLVGVWTFAFIVRSRLAQTGTLTDIADEALLSLLLVVPVMLIGWGLLAFADRRFRLGLFRSKR